MKPEGLFTIGEISVTCGISVNALRFYEAKRLLIPAHTDPDTGYRYYSHRNLLRLQEILDLRDAGFSLGEIKAYLDGNTTAQDRLAELTARRRMLDRAIETIGIRAVAQGDITVSEIALPERLCLCRTFQAKDADHLFAEILTFYGETIRRGIPISRAWPEFCEYPDSSLFAGGFPMTDFAVTACLPVDPEKAPPEAVLRPSGNALAVNYKGNYAGLQDAYAAIRRHIAEHGFTPAGYPQEIYLEISPDGSVKPDCEDYITQVIVPVKRMEKK